MIRATELGGRAVVDMDVAEKLGNIHKVILDPDSRRVAGFVISRGSSALAAGTETTLPASAVHAIGPDALTVRRNAITPDEEARLDRLPRVSDLVGRKVVSQDGRVLGTVDDVLIDAEDGRIVGYPLRDSSNVMGKLEDLISGQRKDRHAPYLRADVDLRAGHDLIVAPDNALADGIPGTAPAPPVTPPPVKSSTGRWADSPSGPGTSSQWIRRDDENHGR